MHFVRYNVCTSSAIAIWQVHMLLRTCLSSSVAVVYRHVSRYKKEIIELIFLINLLIVLYFWIVGIHTTVIPRDSLHVRNRSNMGSWILVLLEANGPPRPIRIQDCYWVLQKSNWWSTLELIISIGNDDQHWKCETPGKIYISFRHNVSDKKHYTFMCGHENDLIKNKR